MYPMNVSALIIVIRPTILCSLSYTTKLFSVLNPSLWHYKIETTNHLSQKIKALYSCTQCWVTTYLSSPNKKRFCRRIMPWIESVLLFFFINFKNDDWILKYLWIEVLKNEFVPSILVISLKTSTFFSFIKYFHCLIRL